MIPSNFIENIRSNLKDKNVFLTGGTGFFGKSFLDFIIKYCSDINVNITILTRDPDTFLTQHPQYKLSNIVYISGDIESFAFPPGNFDTVLHFATPADALLNTSEPLKMINIIINGMNRVLDFSKAKKIKSFLFTSSGAIYGKQPSDLTHISESYVGAPITTSPGSAYGEAKRLAELMGCETAKLVGFEFKIARCFAFTGPHLKRNGSFAIGNFIGDCLDEKTISISGDGTPYRSYLYSEDLIVWLLEILFRGTNCSAYNVGSDDHLTIEQLAKRVASALKKDVQINVQLKSTSTPVSRYVPDVNKAKTELGLAVWTNLDEAIIKSASTNR